MKVTDYILNDKNCCCIYGVRETETGNTIYVGKTKNLHNRIQSHWYSQNTEIERWMKDNRGCYSYYIIETCNIEELSEKELFYINKLQTDVNGYNHLIVYKTEEEKRESRHKWENDHRKELNDKNKRWNEKNPDYLKTYYQKNKERIYELHKKWCKENPEKVKAKEERRKHSEKRKAYMKKYTETHKEQMKAWREAHKEQIKEYSKKYYKEHKVLS